MDVSLESKSLPSVGNSRKSYLKVTSQRLARGKLVHLHGWRSLALPSVGPVAVTSSFQLRIAYRLKHWIVDFLRFEMILFTSSPCILDLLMAKDFQALVLHVSELPIALPKIPYNSPQSRIALGIHYFPSAAVATVGSSPPPVYLSSDQVQQLIAYLSTHLQQQTINPLESPSTSEPSISQIYGNNCSTQFFSHPFVPSHAWVIDTGGHPPCSVRLSDTLNLDNVLFVPMFTFNLLSISALTLSHNCSVNFLSNSCFIQDLTRGLTIGKVHLRAFFIVSPNMSSSHSPECISSLAPIQTALCPHRVTTKPTYLSNYHYYLIGHVSSKPSLYPISSCLSYHKLSRPYHELALTISLKQNQTSFSQAIESQVWRDAMNIGIAGIGKQ
ncbi:hypothetical protein CK203_060765 [Vitis vinifera]|uniref:Retrovirus-related Pol polyprotein from transposon RE2 n=1 Tax=Vitis vinifera TaxID=29760 RepID=A0A438FRS9_VITVI|nr:hypothetical protein CK203_060765 [Vitis vinifera]